MTDLAFMLTDIAKSIVDHPDQVSVDTEISDEGKVLTLHVAEEDMGMVIGKHGKIARAIRTIIKSAAKNEENKVSVEIK